MVVNVIGAGLAGSEAALQLAKRGIKVNLYEMRPEKSTGAHKTDKFAEFVCSNSLGASDCSNASGLLKKEMEILGGELIKIARKCSVPAGNALAIDRELFSQTVTDRIKNDENITILNQEVLEIPDGYTIMASGPLTSESLASSIKDLTQSEHLHFFDAIAPIVEKDSINFDKAFYASRYDKGEGEGGIAGIEGQAQQRWHARQDGEPEGRREGQQEYDHCRMLAGHRFGIGRKA